MSDDVAQADPQQILFAANLLGREFIKRGLVESGRSSREADQAIQQLVSKLGDIELDDHQTVVEALADELRRTIEILAKNTGPLGAATNKALDIAQDAAEATGWGDDASRVILAIGFAISLLVIVSNTTVSGTVGGITIDKSAGVPPEVVEIVRDVAEEAGNALEKSLSVTVKIERDSN